MKYWYVRWIYSIFESLLANTTQRKYLVVTILLSFPFYYNKLSYNSLIQWHWTWLCRLYAHASMDMAIVHGDASSIPISFPCSDDGMAWVSTLILSVRFNLDLSSLWLGEELFYSEGVQVVYTVMLRKIETDSRCGWRLPLGKYHVFGTPRITRSISTEILTPESATSTVHMPWKTSVKVESSSHIHIDLTWNCLMREEGWRPNTLRPSKGGGRSSLTNDTRRGHYSRGWWWWFKMHGNSIFRVNSMHFGWIPTLFAKCFQTTQCN